MCRSKFEPHAALHKEKFWHPSQQVTDHADGSCTLSFKATGIDEVKRWVLTYGGTREVAPPSFAQPLSWNYSGLQTSIRTAVNVVNMGS